MRKLIGKRLIEIKNHVELKYKRIAKIHHEIDKLMDEHDKLIGYDSKTHKNKEKL